MRESSDPVARRRAELAAFLRTRRRALQPDDVGLAVAGRRHVRGLRREDVAILAGIGVSWYTMLEQGVVRNVSDRTLRAIATALRLSDIERDHLIALAADHAVTPDGVRQTVRAFAEGIVTGPAFLLDPRCDVVAWNASADELFGFSAVAGGARNLLWLMFLEPRMRLLFATWDQAARDMVGTLRANFARYGDDGFVAFVDALRAASPAFTRVWDERPVRTIPTHETCIMRSGEETLEVHLTAFEALDAPGHTLVALVPLSGAFPASTTGA